MHVTAQSRPSQAEILVSHADHDRLSVLARGYLDRTPEMAEDLLAEMDRARIAEDAAMPANVVRMGSTVTLHDPEGGVQRVTLVYPAEADIAEKRISVMTPLGTALIGVCAGRAVSWRSRDGRVLSATIGAVEQPASRRAS